MRCLECQPFLEESERVFHPILQQYKFEFVECWSQRDGRECRLKYHSNIGSLLFVLQDGGMSCFLAKQQVPFPPPHMLSDGNDIGWYHIVTIAEIVSDSRLYTAEIDRAIQRGNLHFYEWQSGILSKYIEDIFPFIESTDKGELDRLVSQVIKARRTYLE